MQTKLTLRMEQSLIEAAKKEAARRGTSLSRLVADVFQSFQAVRTARSDTERSDLETLGPRTRRLLGAIKESEADP